MHFLCIIDCLWLSPCDFFHHLCHKNIHSIVQPELMSQTKNLWKRNESRGAQLKVKNSRDLDRKGGSNTNYNKLATVLSTYS